jgi:hypothetical protein
MTRTGHRRSPTRASTAWLTLAWLPVSLVLAFVAGEGLTSALGYPSGGSAPAWVMVLTDPAVVVVAAVPCVVAFVLARRGRRAGAPGCTAALVTAGLLGVALLSVTVVSLVNDLTW